LAKFAKALGLEFIAAQFQVFFKLFLQAFVIWIFLCCGDLTNTRASDAERHNDLNLTGGTFSIRLSNGTTARQGRTLLLAAGLLHRFYDRLFGNFEQQPPIIINNNNNNDLQGGNSNMDRGYNTQGIRYNNPEEERAF